MQWVFFQVRQRAGETIRPREALARRSMEEAFVCKGRKTKDVGDDGYMPD